MKPYRVGYNSNFIPQKRENIYIKANNMAKIQCTDSFTAHAKTQMQTQEADSKRLRVFYSSRGRQKVSQERQRVIIQIRVRQVQDSRQDQDRQIGQNWED